MKKFERITISGSEILDYPATWRILKNLERYNLLPDNFDEPEIVQTQHAAQQLMFQALETAAPNNHPVALGKRVLHLTTQPGTFLKQCPGSPDMLCCHYHVINMVSNCPYDCSYCYLQTYLNQPMTTFFVNEDEILNQVRKICERPPVEQLRIGTGELSDSLALDPITEFSASLANLMSNYENVRLELKTKSKNVEHLFHLPKKDHVVIAWSMNPAAIIEKEEHGTARFEERLRAAKAAARAGFGIGFHLDPLIHFEGWKEHYTKTIETILDEVPHDRIRWISLGSLRYQPQLKAIALHRRPSTTIFDEESVTGEDGKIRYLRSMRSELFEFVDQLIKNKAPDLYTYLCMETKPVWQKSLGRLPDRGF